MEAVEKMKARAAALAALGLDQTAGSEDIRQAWRNIAFNVHSDRTRGDSSEFTRAKEAYDLLRLEGLVSKGAQPGKPRRPKLRKRVISLDITDIDACRTLLNKALPQSAGGADETCTADQIGDSDHIPEAVGFHGRNLTYFVSSPVRQGQNRVALPTSVLAGARRTETEVLSFQAKETGGGEVVVPDTIRDRKFPGAKSVRIRFDASKQIRDEFCLAS
ncbi:J domain-containing protein [Ruegeria lacuscaerulensis]|uniref:J domain-containing protein n=1 Tax=Ruegeria lacuscaerulensis TaxID=55218 RepID=UPI00147BE6A4|nr:J domain-containing protein [Ruegeria lacuscaerulensis]